jgi:hypothetical protein
MKGCCPLGLQQVRQLSDRRRLAGAVDADDQHDVRPGVPRRPPPPASATAKMPRISSFTRSRRLGPPPCPLFTAPTMRSVAADADVGRDQQFLERLERVDVHRPSAASGASARRDDLLEAIDDLLLGAGEAVAQAVSNPMKPIVRFYCSKAGPPAFEPSARPFAAGASGPRPPRAASCRPDSTSAICAAIGSSTPTARRAPARCRGPHPLGHHLHAGQDLGERPPAAEFDARDCRLRLRRRCR